MSTLPEGRRRRWPSEIRRAAIELMNSGLSVKAIEAASGISSKILASWRPKPEAVEASGFRQLNVRDDEPSRITLQWGSNLEVSGLKFSELKELLREGLI
ncbi:MAG: transposase [Bdellovibrionales bacterium]|nr:transposase [Bdellovibrionales bacterium]